MGVVVPDRRDAFRDGVLAGDAVPATFGIDLFRLARSNSVPEFCGELRDGRKLLSFGVPADPSPSINLETKSLPGVSTNVDPALWLSTRA